MEMFEQFFLHEIVYEHQDDILISKLCHIYYSWIFSDQQLYVGTYVHLDLPYVEILLNILHIYSKIYSNRINLFSLQKNWKFIEKDTVTKIPENTRIHMILDVIIDIFELSEFHFTALQQQAKKRKKIQK